MIIYTFVSKYDLAEYGQVHRGGCKLSIELDQKTLETAQLLEQGRLPRHRISPADRASGFLRTGTFLISCHQASRELIKLHVFLTLFHVKGFALSCHDANGPRYRPMHPDPSVASQ
jgi:hypothetical protein